jgi:hypothetical protein
MCVQPLVHATRCAFLTGVVTIFLSFFLACVCRKEWRQGRHIADLFASNANNECERTYSLHGRRRSAGVNNSMSSRTFGGLDLYGSTTSFQLLGWVWRKLLNDGAIATVVVPLWQSSTW